MPRPLVLIIDDDVEVRNFERVTLKQLFRVEEAADGLTGLKRARELRPMVVVTDMVMPGVDGLELSKTIKADPDLAKVAVILVTGATQGEELPDGFWKLGTVADDFLQKPFDASTLLAAVQKQVERLLDFKPLPPGRGTYD